MKDYELIEKHGAQVVIDSGYWYFKSWNAGAISQIERENMLELIGESVGIPESVPVNEVAYCLEDMNEHVKFADTVSAISTAIEMLEGKKCNEQ